jgi:tRNA(adenine34) deaminase
MTDVDQAEIDDAMMRRCIALSAEATRHGEFPFASVVARRADVVAESTNMVARNRDVCQHAELLAISKAQRILGSKDLSGCTLYSNIEPCVMCAFPIRETRISRVVFAVSSPLMGGFSRWNVLRDADLSAVMPEAFGPVPETVAGLLRAEAEKVWWRWNPVIWAVIRHRGCFGAAHHRHEPMVPVRLGVIRRAILRYCNRHSPLLAIRSAFNRRD